MTLDDRRAGRLPGAVTLRLRGLAEFPREILKRAWETGLMNIEIPAEYGGLGGSCVDNQCK